MKPVRLCLAFLAALADARIAPAAKPPSSGDNYLPHTPTLAFYIFGPSTQADADRIVAMVQKLPSVRKVSVNLPCHYAADDAPPSASP